MSAERALQRSVLCKEACFAKDSVLQRRVLCKEALQRSAQEARSAKKRALQRSVLCKEACSKDRSAKKRALQRSVLCKDPEADWPPFPQKLLLASKQKQTTGENAPTKKKLGP